MKDADSFGVVVGGAHLNWPAVIERQHAIVAQVRPPAEKIERYGGRLIRGEARFTDPQTLEVNGTRVRGDKVIIASGSEPVVPPLPGRELAITSNELLFLPEFPPRLVLVGAGAIGLEMAGAFSDLGAAVTVIGQEDEILPAFDPDVAAYLRVRLESRGVTVHRGARVTRFEGRRGDITTRFEVAGAAREVRSDVVCLAAGRRWSPRSLAADTLGLETNKLGLQTSPYLRTSVDHIYAAGDAAGNAQLTPWAAHEGRVAAHNALRGDEIRVDRELVPQTIFTTPEIARAGLTHSEARRRAIACHVVSHDMTGASNGVASGEDAGYLKLVFEARTERLLGVQVVAFAAAEVIQLAALAVRSETTAEDLAAQLSIHPSQAERFIKVAAHQYHEMCEL
jgi:pyruvate/2-oxoglutarate dehydrogenase complex dihydrolipoamide dehydrogenase (E3) component